MLRTMLVSAAALAITGGAAGAQTIIYDDGYAAMGAPVIVERRAAPVIVERRAAVLPTAPVIVAPAERFVIVDDFDRLSPGAPFGTGPNDEKKTAGEARRDLFDRHVVR